MLVVLLMLALVLCMISIEMRGKAKVERHTGATGTATRKVIAIPESQSD